MKHVKIEKGSEGYFLDASRYFKSVPELVQHYENHSLEESFSALNTNLKVPFRMAFMGNFFSFIFFIEFLSKFLSNFYRIFFNFSRFCNRFAQFRRHGAEHAFDWQRRSGDDFVEDRRRPGLVERKN